MELKLHRAQSEVVQHLFGEGSDDEARAAVLTMSRGAGKSLLASVVAAKGIELLLDYPPTVLNKRVIIVGPTWGQTVSIYVPYLNGVLNLDYYANKCSEHNGKWWFGPNNDVTLELASAESIQRLRGLGAFLVITDESTSWEIDVKEAYEGVISPMQTTRHPNRWKRLDISTPLGRDYFWELSNNQEKDHRWKTVTAPYQAIPHLDLKEIEAAKATMDPVKFAREYECSFEGSSNRIYYMFDRKKHVRKDLPEFHAEGAEQVLFGIDFNVGKVIYCRLKTRRIAGNSYLLGQSAAEPRKRKVQRLGENRTLK